jgi:hypothetical protein
MGEPGRPTVTNDGLRAFLQERLADWKIPDSIYLERGLPLQQATNYNHRSDSYISIDTPVCRRTEAIEQPGPWRLTPAELSARHYHL